MNSRRSSFSQQIGSTFHSCRGATSFVVSFTLLGACGGQTEVPSRASNVPVPVPTQAWPVDAGADVDISDAGGPVDSGDAGEQSVASEIVKPPCPDDMAFVDTTYCPDVELNCIQKAYNKANRITICKEFAKDEQRCKTDLRRQRFCIDRYEYPSREGAHPPVMVDWYDALGMCQEQGKRLCWESEWVSACEGPSKKPFPYGYKRDPNVCNIDNPWLQPTLEKIYSKDKTIQEPELFKLDQSVSSGERPGCKSDFGVYDLTGNVDEWVNAEKNYPKSKWAGLKGGAWGHVRNACRPMTVSHEPEFTYYFVSFRCCADAIPDAAADQDPRLWRPPAQPEPKKKGPLSKGWTPQTRAPHQPAALPR